MHPYNTEEKERPGIGCLYTFGVLSSIVIFPYLVKGYITIYNKRNVVNGIYSQLGINFLR